MSGTDPPTFALPARYAYDGKTLSGGQGKVYVCRDLNLERLVAIKALHAITNIAYLLKEIAAHGKVKSKHVVEMYEVLADSGGTPYAIVLEYVPGDTLQDVSKLPPTFERKLLLIYQLACGLHDIHSADVIHRDIKPENMKVDGAGVLKVFDLGIASLDATTAVTVAAAGTVVYRAPELHGALPRPVSCAADMYALGVVAWHILNNGQFPGPLLEVPPQVSGLGIPSLQNVAPELGAYAGVLDRTLNVTPTQRPEAKELKEALSELLTKGKRRGVFAYGSQTWELNQAGKVTQISLAALGSVSVAYNGTKFVVRTVTGDVYINNQVVVVGAELPGSCVLTFGAPTLGKGRAFVAFDESQPEIVL